MGVSVWVCVWVGMCVCMCIACAYLHACIHACVHAYMCAISELKQHYTELPPFPFLRHMMD